MSQHQHLQTELRRSSRTTNRKSYSDYFSDDDMLTEHEEDIDLEDLEEEEEYQDASNEEYKEEAEEISGDSSDNDSGKEEQQSEASVKNINTKFACGLCSNTLSDPYIIPACCHRFCCKCIQESIKAGIGPCPTCRDHSVSFESLRRDEMMGRLLTRYKILQEKIQKKKIDEGGHKIQKKSTLESTATDETVHGEVDEKNTATPSGTRKRRKREISSNENSSKTSSNIEVMKKKVDSTAANESKTLKVEPVVRKKKHPASTRKDPKKESIEVGLDSTDKEDDILEKLQRSGKVPRFEERLRLLKKYKEEHGHCNVPKSHTEKGLGDFSNYLRLVHAGIIEEGKHPELKLTKERMEKLNKLQFRWRFQHSFDEYFSLLQSFKAKTGHCNVTKSDKFSVEYPGLATWASRIRGIRDGRREQRKRAKLQLTEERIKQLDKIGFRWNAVRTWDEYIDDLQDFKSKYGHCDVPFHYSENKSLGFWVGKLRSMRAGTRKIKKKESPHKLTDERIAQLDKMGFKWKIRG